MSKTGHLNRTLEKLTWIHKAETRKTGWSFLYFYSILSGYFLLRPVRDEMGIVYGADQMQWLFTGTFTAMLLLVPVFGYVTSKFRIFSVLKWSLASFIIQLFIFYFLFLHFGKTDWLAVVFFVWLSVFNLFIVSLFWSLMCDVFSIRQSKRLFGIIAAGGSIGALTGPLFASFIAMFADIQTLLLVAGLFLLIALFLLRRITAMELQQQNSDMSKGTHTNRVVGSGILASFKKTLGSFYLSGIVLFILLYTSVSTMLYFQQAHIVEDILTVERDRLVYFSTVDFITNGLALLGQLFLTNRFSIRFGLPLTLALVPAMVGIGFSMLSVHTSLYLLAGLYILHRAGNYTLLKPGREILFTATRRDEKYQAKNFIDTAVYRGGDALTGWLFAMLLTLGLSFSGIALISVLIAILWSITGFRLGKSHRNRERSIRVGSKIKQ